MKVAVGKGEAAMAKVATAEAPKAAVSRAVTRAVVRVATRAGPKVVARVVVRADEMARVSPLQPAVAASLLQLERLGHSTTSCRRRRQG
jgi:hypothetical protein